jgi:hypothetical protein
MPQKAKSELSRDLSRLAQIAIELNCCLLARNFGWFAKSDRKKDRTQSQCCYQNINSCFHRLESYGITLSLTGARGLGVEIQQIVRIANTPSSELTYLCFFFTSSRVAQFLKQTEFHLLFHISFYTSKYIAVDRPRTMPEMTEEEE